MRKKWIIAIPIILLMLVVCAAIVVVGIFSLSAANLRGIRFPVIAGKMNVVIDESEQSRYNVSGPAQLKVNNIAGMVRVEKGAAGVITIDTKKTARGYDQESAQANLDRMEVIITQQGNVVDVRVEVKPIEVNWSGQVDFTIQVPEDTEVEMASTSGDLYLAGTRAPANLNTSFGSVTVNDVGEGALTVDTRSGKVEVTGVQAGDQRVELHSRFGDITLRNAEAGDVVISSNNGQVTLRDVQAGGVMEVSSYFGAVEVTESSASPLTAETRNGAITLTDVTVNGEVKVSSDFGPLRLENVRAAGYSLDTRNGSVHVDGAAGKVHAHSDFGDVVVQNGSEVTLDLRSKNGAVRFDGSLGAGPHSLRSDFGSIELLLPEDTALNLDLKTDFGKIQTGFEVTVQGAVETKHLVGSINGGGDMLTVVTRNGNITIESRP